MPAHQEPHWFHAATLIERLAGEPFADPTPDDDTAFRLQAWKSQPPFDRPSSFERRLASDGLTEDKLRRLLGEPMQALRDRMAEPPWLTGIRAALASPAADRLS